MADERWPAAKNIQFINEYHNYQCLWDPKHPHYKNRHVREEAYKKLKVVMKMENYRDVIAKIRILRNTYNNENLKAKKSMTTDTPYVSKISWLKYMSFLKNIGETRVKTGKTPNNISEEISEIKTEELTLPTTSTEKGIKSSVLDCSQGERWNADKNIQFINEYHRHTCLWDRKHPQYKNRNAREAAYNEIMAAMEMKSVREVSRKLRALRNTYNNEVLRTKKSMATETPYVSRIPWLPHMDFLKTINNLEDNSDSVLEETVEETDSDSIEFKSEDSNTPNLKSLELENDSQHLTNAGGYDEFEMFGQNVAQQLRQMPLEFALETEEMVLATIRRQRVRLLEMQKSQSDPLSSEQLGLITPMNISAMKEETSPFEAEDSFILPTLDY